MIVCSICKKFVRDVLYKINGLEEISQVTGLCKKHGRVNITDWEYDELVGSDDYEKPRMNPYTGRVD
jgi:hypothetical protein